MPKSQQPEEASNEIVDRIKNNNIQSVLDIGSGKDAKWGKLLHSIVGSIDGVEVFAPHVAKIKSYNVYDNIYNSNISEFIQSDNFKNSNYEAAILGDVLEHLGYEKARELIATLKNKVKYIYLIIPVTVCVQSGRADGNKYEKHVYHWGDKEIRYDLDFNIIRFDTNDNNLVCIGAYEWKVK